MARGSKHKQKGNASRNKTRSIRAVCQDRVRMGLGYYRNDGVYRDHGKKRVFSDE